MNKSIPCTHLMLAQTIRLWRGSDLSAVATLSGHKRGVWRVSFSPVDRCLVSCSGDRTLRLWSMVDYSCLKMFEGGGASILCVKFVSRGMQLLSGGGRRVCSGRRGKGLL